MGCLSVWSSCPSADWNALNPKVDPVGWVVKLSVSFLTAPVCLFIADNWWLAPCWRCASGRTLSCPDCAWRHHRHPRPALRRRHRLLRLCNRCAAAPGEWGGWGQWCRRAGAVPPRPRTPCAATGEGQGRRHPSHLWPPSMTSRCGRPPSAPRTTAALRRSSPVASAPECRSTIGSN